jgi:excisionase family DNA binding protein
VNKLLTTNEAAEILGISPIAVANLLRDKKLPGIKRRGPDGIDRWFIRREDVALYCAELAIFNMLQKRAREQPVEEGVPL